METFKLKLSKLQLEIFRLLCVKTGEKLNQSMVAKLLGISSTGIAKSLPLLEKENLIHIKKDQKMNLTIIELNRDNKRTIQLKRVENLKMLYESEAVDFIEENNPGGTIVLFGSYGRGEDTIKSDIDIAIIGRKERKLNLGVYKKKLEKPININYYDSLNDINKELKENICNGIVLSGGIEF